MDYRKELTAFVGYLKVLTAEAGENVLVAGSWLFLIIAFFAAMPEPKAALFPLVLGVACFLLARRNDLKA